MFDAVKYFIENTFILLDTQNKMTEIESEQVLTPAKVPESSKDMSSKKERNKIEHFEAPKCVSNSRNTKSVS